MGHSSCEFKVKYTAEMVENAILSKIFIAVFLTVSKTSFKQSQILNYYVKTRRNMDIWYGISKLMISIDKLSYRESS